MEDSNSLKQNKIQVFYTQLRTSFFNIMFELLKEKNTSLLLGCSIILIMFIQLIGHLFDPSGYAWKDQFFLNFIVQLCGYSRLITAINDSGSTFFYWALIIFAIIYLVAMLGLLFYMNYFLKNRKHYAENIVKLLQYMILLLYWVFYMPFYESFISILRCENGYHYIDQSIECFQGIHIFYIVICIFFLIILVSTSLIIAMLFNETQPVQEDCLSRLETSFEVGLIIYRSVVGTFTNFCDTEICSWILIAAYVISSAMLCFQYYKQIPYYNQFVSVFCGSLIYIYFWISVNAILMKVLTVNGHIVIILAGIPLICYLVKNLREKRIEQLVKTNIDKVQVDIDALIQVHNMTDFSKGINSDQSHHMSMIGIINIHVLECQNLECPCKEEYELFDVGSNNFTVRNEAAPHLDQVFLDHFVKRLYEDSLTKFINSPGIHIAFSFYLFKVMKNIHASLIELNIAQKKKPSLQQQFTIFRYKNIIEEFIQQDHLDHKHVYPELSNVIEFERLFGEMQRAIEKVCNLQVEFWTHLTTVVPDLNILNDLGKKVYDAGEEADQFWVQLCKINPNYQQALTIYGEYLKDIRNHENIGNQYIDRALNNLGSKKLLDENTKSSDILFSDDTTIIHMSGNRESIGKILKTSQGLAKVFGYSKTEVVGHSINIMMPAVIARKHTEFLERFFKTGRQIIFYQERILFATHRNGHCFQTKLLVKQMPSLSEGIQYVGMVKPIVSDVEYLLTDMEGVIDSFTKGMTNLIGLTPNLFKDKDTHINIQLLAPDLITFFADTQKKNGKAAKSKYRDPGGENLMLIVPKDFNTIAKSEAKSNPRSGGSRSRGKQNANNQRAQRSPLFRDFLKYLQKQKKAITVKLPVASQLLKQREYTECERKKEVTCEITCIDIKCASNDSMRMLAFKFSATIAKEKNGKDQDNELFMDMNEHQSNRDNAFAFCKQNTDSTITENDIRSALRSRANSKNTGKPMSKTNTQYSGLQTINSGVFQSEINVGKLGSSKQPDSSHPKEDADDVQELSQDAESVSQESQDPKSGTGTKGQVSEPSSQKQPKQIKFQEEAKSQSLKKDQEGSQSPKNEEGAQDVEEETSGLRTDEESNGEDTESKKEEVVEPPQLKQDAEPPKQEAEPEANMSDVETPRVDVGALKLNSARKEKNSFLQELKKQSFLVSEDSTQKVDVKDSINISAIPAKNSKDNSSSKRSFVGGQPQSKDSLGHYNVMQSPEKMVKKQNMNNLKKNFFGDDHIEEEMEDPNEALPSPNDRDLKTKKTVMKQQTIKDDSSGSGQALRTDESLEGETVPKPAPKATNNNHLAIKPGQNERNTYSGDLGEGKRAKRQQTRFSKKLPLDESSSEDDDDEEGEEKKQDIRADAEVTDEESEDLDSDQEEPAPTSIKGKGEPSGEKQPLIQSDANNSLGGAAVVSAKFGLDKPNTNKASQDSSRSKLTAPDQARQVDAQGNRKSQSIRSVAKQSEVQSQRTARDTVATNQRWKGIDLKKKDTGKVKTNPKYRCLDENASGEDDDEPKQEDLQNLSSKEMDFRETIIKCERKKRKKEKKIKEREQKRIKALNGDEHSAGGVSGDPTAGGHTSGGTDDDEETHSKSSVSSEDSDSKGSPDELRGSDKSSSTPKQDDAASSVQSRQTKTERNHYILRSAIDEKFIPNSITNLGRAANFIFLILILLSVVYYVMQNSLFGSLYQSILNIHNSEARLSYIIDITLRTRTLILMNSNNTYPTHNQTLYNQTIADLIDSATQLNLAQTELSLQTSSLSSSQALLINPQNVTMKYLYYNNMPSFYVFTMWEAIMEIVVSAYSIATMPLYKITDFEPTAYFVMQNSLNSVFEALNNSTDAIISQTDNNRQTNMNVFLYLLIAASCSMFFSILFLIPVINKVKKNKQEVLELFTHRNIEKHIDDQLKVCRNFVQLRLQQTNEVAQAEHDLDGDDQNRNNGGQNGQAQAGDKNLQNELTNNKYMKRLKKKNKGRKWKPLNSDVGTTLLKFLIFICIIEGYFLANYLLSAQFLQEVQDLTQELKLLISRHPTQSFLLLIQKEMVYWNGTSLINGERAELYVPQYQESLYDEEEQLLDKFSMNYNYHSAQYNDQFNNLIYSDICPNIPEFNADPLILQACETFDQGILTKGLYSSVIKYWDYLRQYNYDFTESNRTQSTIQLFMNDTRLQVAEQMEDFYFKTALSLLVTQLEADINSFFNFQNVQNRTIFIIYIIYIIGLYYLIWRRFVSILQNELWKTKSMLGILPTKLCFEIEEIRYFIYAHSSNDFISTKI